MTWVKLYKNIYKPDQKERAGVEYNQNIAHKRK